MSKRCVVPVVLLCACCSVYAQQADLGKLKKQYDDLIQVIEAETKQAQSAILEAYTNELPSFRDKAQEAGDLDKLNAIYAEMSRAQTEQSLPTPLPDVQEVGTVAGVYQQQAQWTKTNRAQRIVTLASYYTNRLDTLQRRLTKEGKLDDATAVQQERKVLWSLEPLAGAKSLLDKPQPSSTPPVVAKPEPPNVIERWSKGDTKTLVEIRREQASSTPPTTSKRQMKNITPDLSGGDRQNSGIVLHNKRTTSKDSYAPPLEIEYVCKTDTTNIRLAYGCDELIFNWENNLDELRIGGGPVSGQHRMGAGRVSVNKFITIRQVVKKDKMDVFVDDELRASWQADFSKIDSTISVSSALGSKVTVQSIRVMNLAK